MPSTKSATPTSPVSPSPLKAWFLASRPKTWMASLSPVLIGGNMAPSIQPKVFALTLLFSWLIQIGTNFANDAFDFLKGADTSARQGPQRAVAQGWISPRAMFFGVFFTFAAAFLVAIPLMMRAGWWSGPLCGVAIGCGVLYTGGPKPLGYLGLGELLVFLFFGPIAACGTYFLQTNTLNLPTFFASLAPGFLSCSLLIANNLRDEHTDRLANKKTLIVRWGHPFGKWEYVAAILGAAVVPFLLVFFFGASPRLLHVSWIFLLPALRAQSLFQTSALLLFLYTCLFCLLW